MGDFDPKFIHDLASESWPLYIVGMVLIMFRIYARIHRLGVRNLQTDDYLMLLAGCLYTVLIVCLNVIAGGGGSNLFEPSLFPTFTAKEIEERIKGSKIVIVSEQAMLNVIYTIKLCMLFMYTRLTLSLPIQRMVFYLAIYVGIGWLATEIAFFTACRPFSGYYAMPPPNAQCTTLENYAIVQGCFNISSDLLMLMIPFPLITRLNVQWKQKVVLSFIFSMGAFVIAAAVMTKVFNLTNVFDPLYMLWYIRESSVAIYVSNLPMIWPLLREWFPLLSALGPGQKISSKQNGGLGFGAGGSRSTGAVKIGSAKHGNGGRKGSVHAIVTTIHRTSLMGESMEELSKESNEGGLAVEKKSWEEDHCWDQNQQGGIRVERSTTFRVEMQPPTRAPQQAYLADSDLERGNRW